jgi:predicted phosphate transport protein (TIGR00153 family)
MRLALVPRTTEFYGLFAAAGANAAAAAKLVSTRFRELPDSSVAHAAVKDLEHEGDRLTHDIVELLNTHFVTPFDREDIYGLATAIDDVVDHIEHASDLLDVYRIDAPMDQAIEQCRVLVDVTDALADALGHLRGFRGTRDALARVKQCEDEGDRVARDALAALFEDEDVDPRAMIRWKDVFEALEEAIDACETAAHVIGNVVVKNA